MKKLMAFCSLLLFIGASQSFAADPTEEQLLRLGQTIGITEQFEAQKTVVAKQIKENAEQSVRIISASIPDMPQELQKYIQEEMEVYLTKANNAYDTKLMTDTYMTLLGTKLSAEDVDQIIAFYETEAGKKLTRGSIEITAPWTEQTMKDYNQKVVVYSQEFLSNLTQKMAGSK